MIPGLPHTRLNKIIIDWQLVITVLFKFLFPDVQQMSQGMPHWVKCWCSLQGMYLKTWKQPEDQFVSDPLLVIEINEVNLLVCGPNLLSLFVRIA